MALTSPEGKSFPFWSGHHIEGSLGPHARDLGKLIVTDVICAVCIKTSVKKMPRKRGMVIRCYPPLICMDEFSMTIRTMLHSIYQPWSWIRNDGGMTICHALILAHMVLATQRFWKVIMSNVSSSCQHLGLASESSSRVTTNELQMVMFKQINTSIAVANHFFCSWTPPFWSIQHVSTRSLFESDGETQLVFAPAILIAWRKLKVFWGRSSVHISFSQENLTLARKKFDEGRLLMNNFFSKARTWSWKEVFIGFLKKKRHLRKSGDQLSNIDIHIISYPYPIS